MVLRNTRFLSTWQNRQVILPDPVQYSIIPIRYTIYVSFVPSLPPVATQNCIFYFHFLLPARVCEHNIVYWTPNDNNIITLHAEDNVRATYATRKPPQSSMGGKIRMVIVLYIYVFFFFFCNTRMYVRAYMLVISRTTWSTIFFFLFFSRERYDYDS